jgi:hypothetical protein
VHRESVTPSDEIASTRVVSCDQQIDRQLNDERPNKLGTPLRIDLAFEFMRGGFRFGR